MRHGNNMNETVEEQKLRETVVRVAAAKRRGSRGIIVGDWSDGTAEDRQPGDEPKAKRTAGAGGSLPPWIGEAQASSMSARDVRQAAMTLLPSHMPGQEKAAEPCAAPALTNRGASNSKEGGGIDWCSLTFRVVHSNWRSLRSVLAAGKDDAQQAKGETGGIVELPGGTIARVGRTGTKGYVRCQWTVELDGMLISFADREYAHETTPNILATISGRVCLEKGYAWCSQRIDQFLASIGAEIISESISRLDICTDLPGVGVLQFFQAWTQDRHITRATKYSLHGERDLNGAQTFTLGSREELCCRMYDKLAEVGGDPEKLELMRLHRWGGTVPERATRVEFECHTEILRELGIVTRADLVEGLPKLVKYLTGDWLRFASKKVDRTNTTRSKNAFFWDKVVSLFNEWVGVCQVADVHREKLKGVQKPQLEKQAMGCIASAMVASSNGIETSKQAALLLLRKVVDYSEYLQEKLVDRGIGRIFANGDTGWQDTLEKQLNIWWQNDAGIRPMSPSTWGM